MDTKFIIALGIGIVGIIVTVAVALWAVYRRMPKEIAYDSRSEQLIGPGSEQSLPSYVKIVAKERIVPRVVAGTVTIWNRGHEAVRRRDIVKSDPLCIVLPPGAEFLDMQLQKTTRAVNEFRLDHNVSFPARIFTSFEFLDHKDGALITILHSGPDEPLAVEGTIIEQRDGPQLTEPIGPEDFAYPLLPSLLMIALMVAAAVLEIFFEGTPERWAKVCAAGVVVVLVGMLVHMRRRADRKAPRNLWPSSFLKMNDEA